MVDCYLVDTRDALSNFSRDVIITGLYADEFLYREVSQREEAKKTVKKTLEERSTSGKNRWFFTPLSTFLIEIFLAERCHGLTDLQNFKRISSFIFGFGRGEWLGMSIDGIKTKACYELYSWQLSHRMAFF